MEAMNQALEIMDCVNAIAKDVHIIVNQSICENNIELYAIRDRKNEVIRRLIQAGFRYGYDGLKIAAIFGNLEAAVLISQQNIFTSDDYSCMFEIACELHNYNFAKWCLARGADVNSTYNLLLSITDDDDAVESFLYESWEREYCYKQEIKIEDADDEEAVKYVGYELTYLLILHGADIYCDENEENTDILDRIPDKSMAQRLRDVANVVRMKKVVTFLSAVTYNEEE